MCCQLIIDYSANIRFRSVGTICSSHERLGSADVAVAVMVIVQSASFDEDGTRRICPPFNFSMQYTTVHSRSLAAIAEMISIAIKEIKEMRN